MNESKLKTIVKYRAKGNKVKLGNRSGTSDLLISEDNF